MKIFSTIAICAVLFSIVSCKNVIDYGDIQKLTSDQATLKINYECGYPSNKLVALEINGHRVSPAAPLLAFRTPFPGGGYNTNGANNSALLSINSGATQVSVVLPRKDTGLDSLVLYSTTFQATGGKNYSLHLTDTASKTKSVLVEENLALPDSSTARYRFINLMPNVASVDLYFSTSTATAADTTQQRTDSLVMGGINYLQISNEFKMKAGVSRTWKIRSAGAAKTAATVLASYLSASSVLNQRVYTAFACGYSGRVPQPPYISFYLIR